MPSLYLLCQDLFGAAKLRRHFIYKHIYPRRGMRILDLGCGPASILKYLPSCIHYVGLDSSKLYVLRAKKRYNKIALFHCMPIESSRNVGLTGFDVVMGLGILHHLSDTQCRVFFSIAAEALNSNGLCLTVDPCLLSVQHPFDRMMIRLDRGRNVRTPQQYTALAGPFFPHVRYKLHTDLLYIP